MIEVAETWQVSYAHHLCGQNLASVHAACHASRKAVDDAVTAIAVPADVVQDTPPRLERFLACKQYTFINASENSSQSFRQ